MKQRNVRSIGIAGSICGSGVTHLSIALANYAASGLGEKTACLELNRHGELSHWKAVNEKNYFTDAGISYYPDVQKDKIPILLNRDYDKIIMDVGDAYIEFREELLRCDQKIVLLNLNPWQEFAAERLIRMMQSEDWGGIKPVFAGVFIEDAVRKKFEKTYGIQMLKIPWIPDPRCIHTEDFSCMEYLLNAIGKGKRKKSRLPF